MTANTAITELDALLASLNPELQPAEYVYCSVPGPVSTYLALQPLASFTEPEGLTLVLEKSRAEAAGLSCSGCFRQITLTVHSSLEAVGLTAAVSSALTAAGISANVIAAYYHDHIFVPADKADEAMAALAAIRASE